MGRGSKLVVKMMLWHIYSREKTWRWLAHARSAGSRNPLEHGWATKLHEFIFNPKVINCSRNVSNIIQPSFFLPAIN